MANPLEYDKDKTYLPQDCALNISPSKFSDFVMKKHKWFREVVLEEDGFLGSTASVLGTVVHHLAECVALQKEVNKDDIYEYINSKTDLEGYDANVVLSNFQSMASVLINEYVLPNMDNYLEVEQVYVADLGEGIYVSGKLDVLEGEKADCCVTDYKTHSSKTKPKAIPQNYKYQLLVYAFLLRCSGYNPTRIKLVYISRNIDGGLSPKTGKPLKSYPPELTVLVESITDEDFDFIQGLLELCKDSLLATEEYPHLKHVIWNDPRLKE